MADRDGVLIDVGTYASEADARLDHEAVKVLREAGEVGYYDVAAAAGRRPSVPSAVGGC